MAGAFTRRDGVNPDLARICQKLPGIVRDCDKDHCSALFNFMDFDGAKAALIKRLDTNGDGKLTAADRDCDINLVGYSWGGVNAAEVARRYVASKKVAPERRHIERLIMLDPYSPAKTKIDVPREVRRVWEYRHSLSPQRDCSKRDMLGPYRGLPAVCTGTTQCRDYDFSLAPQRRFPARWGSQTGLRVGHCSIVHAAAPALMHNLATNRDAPGMPPLARKKLAAKP